MSYDIALCYYSLKQYAPALKHIADIIERGIREHPGKTNSALSIIFFFMIKTTLFKIATFEVTYLLEFGHQFSPQLSAILVCCENILATLQTILVTLKGL